MKIFLRGLRRMFIMLVAVFFLLAPLLLADYTENRLYLLGYLLHLITLTHLLGISE